MIKNYLKSSLRFLLRNRLFFLVNMLSLTTAISSCLVIGFYIKNELSYDKMHQKSERIYRYYTVSQSNENTRSVPFAPLALAPHLEQQFSGVENYVRLWRYRRAMPVSYPAGNINFYEADFGWADPSFFQVFDFPVLKGNPEKALAEIGNLVITASTAKKYFGDQDPIGKTLVFRADNDIELLVTAVMEDFPPNSHFKFDLLANIETADRYFWRGGNFNDELNSWENLFVGGYLLLSPEAEVASLESYANQQVNQHLSISNVSLQVKFQPLQKIHLYSDLDVGEFQANGDITNVYLFAVIGIIILLLGIFNFVNILTAYAGKRAREIGVRKTFGSKRRQIIFQQYLEIMMMMALALILSVGIVAVLSWENVPFIAFQWYKIGNDMYFWLIFTTLMIVFFIAAGAFPSLFLSRFQPVKIMKGQYWKHSEGASIRKSLVFFQFVISSALIISSIIVYQQISFLKNKELGFNTDQVLIIPIHNDGAIIPQFQTLKQEYKQLNEVKYVTASSNVFFSDYVYSNNFNLAGSDESFRWQRYTVDHEFPQTFDLDLLAGRLFDDKMASDSMAFILNQAALKELGLEPEQAIGRQLVNATMDVTATIVGVVEDFHFRSLYNQVEPFVLMTHPTAIDFISVKLNSRDIAQTVVSLKEIWNQVIPNTVFHYDYFDQYSGQVYQKAENMKNLFLIFTLLAILIACLGLFGLAAFTLHLRLKEIGIRKVLGASMQNVWRLLVKDFVLIIIAANLVVWPLVYYIMDRWLANFAYQAPMQWYYFSLAAVFMVFISLLVISYHAIKAASVNPVEILKNE
ncbi:MAG: ABC transporter permease [Candidatus Cyclobacteriaceae bacterium M3_2C_046]